MDYYDPNGNLWFHTFDISSLELYEGGGSALHFFCGCIAFFFNGNCRYAACMEHEAVINAWR